MGTPRPFLIACLQQESCRSCRLLAFPALLASAQIMRHLRGGRRFDPDRVRWTRPTAATTWIGLRQVPIRSEVAAIREETGR